MNPAKLWKPCYESKGKMSPMPQDEIIESTLSFQYEPQAYEKASEYPTYYRALNRQPRSEHPFHIYEDILRQPDLVRGALGASMDVAPGMAREALEKGIQRVFFTGLGASYHLAASAAHAIWRICRLPAEYVESSEALLSQAVFDWERTLVIGLSASGNTVETIEHLQQARESGAWTLAFTNLDNTRLTQIAHDCLVVPGGYGLVWDYTTRLAALYRLAIELAKVRGSETQDFKKLEFELKRLPDLMQHALEAIDSRCQRLGEKIQPLRAVVVPAAGNQLPNAWETALRFEEMAHFPARGRPLVDYLHGGVGYLAPDILTMILAPPGRTQEFALRAAQVTQMVKTPCIAIMDEGDTSQIATLADDVLRVPETPPVFKPLLYILPGQLIPYYTEVARPGGNPEAQRTNEPRYARAFDVAMPPKSH
jgi:glucosamine--fructose-6-phosphate aminotransferase (isomerizing)